jgi:hypothetical protein
MVPLDCGPRWCSLFVPNTEPPGRNAIARAVRNLEDMGNGKLALSVHCLRCRRKAVLLPMSLAMRVGTNYPLEGIYRRLVCKRCGGRGDYLDISLVGR